MDVEDRQQKPSKHVAEDTTRHKKSQFDEFFDNKSQNEELEFSELDRYLTCNMAEVVDNGKSLR